MKGPFYMSGIRIRGGDGLAEPCRARTVRLDPGRELIGAASRIACEDVDFDGFRAAAAG
jgi:hypothetical protein